MKTIELKTTQNVSITYELAPVRDRLLAFILDSVFKIIAVSLLSMLIFWSVRDEDVLILLYVILVFPVVTFYTLFFETFWNGQTLGKRILRIRVMTLSGKQANFYDYLLRWAFRIIDIYLTLGISAVMAVISTKHGQRLGDTLANTIVIKLGNLDKVSLKEILKIDSKMNYEPVYPQIRLFREEDMILIKQSLDRYKQYQNNGHFEVLDAIATHIGERLEIETIPEDKEVFLRTLLKDYIVLTR